MSDSIKSFVEPEVVQSENYSQIMIMGGAIAGINLLLMIFVCFYWTNVDFHTFFTGKPF